MRISVNCLPPGRHRAPFKQADIGRQYLAKTLETRIAYPAGAKQVCTNRNDRRDFRLAEHGIAAPLIAADPDLRKTYDKMACDDASFITRDGLAINGGALLKM